MTINNNPLPAWLGRGELSRRKLIQQSAIVGGVVSTMALAGCAEADATSVPFVPGGPLSVGVFSHFEELDRTLTASYPAEITFEPMVADNHRDQIVSALRAGSSPWDVIPLWSFLTPDMAHRGWLADLTDRVREEFGEDFSDIVGGKGPFMNGFYNGKIYGVPVDVGGTILHWNKQLMTERGLDPEAPNTWHEEPGSINDFVEYAKALTFEKDGVPHWGFSDNWGEQAAISFNTFIQMHGGECMDLSGGDAFGRISFNDDPGVEALQFMVDLLHKHKVVDPASVTYNWVFDILPGYLDGRVGFLKTWPFVAAVAQDTTQSKVPGLVGFAPNFSAVTSATSQDPHFVAIPATAPAGVDAAWDYIKNRLSLPVQRQQAEAGSWAPIYSELYQEPAIRELFTTGDVIVKSLEYPSAVSATPDLQEWRSTLNAAISRALTLQLSPAEALNQAAEQVTANRNAGSARG